MIKIRDKNFLQDKHGFGVHAKDGEDYSLENVCVSDGAIFWQESSPKPGSVTLKNIWNERATGKYAVMAWPPGDQHKQLAVPKLVWDNSGCKHPILQSPYEAAFRGKIDDAWIIRVKFKGALDKHGTPIKQVVQVRHGKKWIFEQCEFIDSWPDIGQQKVEGTGYVTSQRVGSVLFDRCTFHRFNGHLPFSRQPGVNKIECLNCIGPDGKKFSDKW